MKPYRPANGTDGESMFCNWCERCKRDQAYQESGGDEPGCDILARSMAFNIGDPEYPTEWVEDDKGPRCLAFEDIEDPDHYYCRDVRQADLFEVQQ